MTKRVFDFPQQATTPLFVILVDRSRFSLSVGHNSPVIIVIVVIVIVVLVIVVVVVVVTQRVFL